MDNNSQCHTTKPLWRSPYGFGVLIVLGVLLFFLWIEHRAHLLGALPFLIFLLCPVMHLFMHRGHHHKHNHGSGENGSRPDMGGQS